MKEAKEHLLSTMYNLREKLKIANTPEMIKQITDSIIEIVATIERLSGE